MTNIERAKLKAISLLRSPSLPLLMIDVGDYATSYTDGKHIFISKKHTEPFEHLVYTICHEALHLILQHHVRMRNIAGIDEVNHKIYNIAADCVIDIILEKLATNRYEPMKNYCKMHHVVAGHLQHVGINIDDLKSWSTEIIYRELVKYTNKLSKLLENNCDGFDLLIEVDKFDPVTSCVLDIVYLRKHLKSIGSHAGNFEEEYEIVDGAKLDLKKHLKRLHTTFNKGYDDISFLSPSKLNYVYDQLDLVLPSWVNRKSKVLISIDVSGSVSREEYLDYVSTILSNMRSMVADLIMCDAKIQKFFTNIDNFDEVQQEVRTFLSRRRGFGGTSIEPIIEWIKQKKTRYDAWFHFTDLELEIPKSKPRNVRTIYFVTEYNSRTFNKVVPWGRILYY